MEAANRPYLTGVEVSAVEDQYEPTDNLTLRADAVCAYMPNGLERVVVQGPIGDPATRSLEANQTTTASCPSGKTLLGTGGQLSANANSPRGHVGIVAMAPGDLLTDATTVSAFEDQVGTPYDWGVTAYAICA